MIYAIEILGSQWVKVGYSKKADVAARIRELQTGSPFEIQPLFTVEGSLSQEKTIHHLLGVAFARAEVPMPPNEWYPGRTMIMQDFLGELRYGVVNATAYLEQKFGWHMMGGVPPNRAPIHAWPLDPMVVDDGRYAEEDVDPRALNMMALKIPYSEACRRLGIRDSQTERWKAMAERKTQEVSQRSSA